MLASAGCQPAVVFLGHVMGRSSGTVPLGLSCGAMVILACTRRIGMHEAEITAVGLMCEQVTLKAAHAVVQAYALHMVTHVFAMRFNDCKPYCALFVDSVAAPSHGACGH